MDEFELINKNKAQHPLRLLFRFELPVKHELMTYSAKQLSD